MEYIISFKSTNVAIKSEQILLDKKINVTVMPLPPQIGDGCGICLRIVEEELDKVLEIFSENDITDISLHSKKIEDNKKIYSKINL